MSEQSTVVAAPQPVGLRHAPNTAIADTGTPKGRGVFACQHYREGDLVETAPVLVLKSSFDDLPEALKTYVFNWEALTGVPRAQAIVFGYGSMYNHANPSNLRYEADAREGVVRYFAAMDIAPHTELTINYCAGGGHNESDDNSWFERFDIDVIGD